MSPSNASLTPAQTAHALVELGIAKHNTRFEIVFLKAVSAGVMLSFGGLLAEVLGGGATGLTESNPGIAKVLIGFVFPAGLVMLVLQGHELLTSNMMIFPMAAIKRAIPWWAIPVNWFIVLFGNLVGSLFTAAVLVHFTGIISTEPYIHFVQSFAMKKAAIPTWHQIFLRGIGCNWLVCVAIWQGASSKDMISKIVALWIPIWVFVACGFDHIVANMFFIPLGIMFGAEITVGEYIKKSFFASFFGNIIGALLIGLPATYFYLRDYQADGLRAAEEANAPPSLPEIQDKAPVQTHHEKPSTTTLETDSAPH